MPENRFEAFSESLLKLVKGQALYSGNSMDSFQEITEAASYTLNVERVSIWIYSPDRSSIVSVDLFEQSTLLHSSGSEICKKDYPAYFAALAQERFINADNAHIDPRTSEFSADYLTSLGIQSLLDAPIRYGGKIIGVICLEHTQKVRIWSEEEMTYASSLADLVSHALEAQKRASAEAALQESESRYRSLIENIPDLIYKTDYYGLVTYVSPSVMEMTGYTIEEAIGKNLMTDVFIEPSRHKGLSQAFMRDGMVKNYELKLRKKDGTQWWGLISATASKSADGKIVSIDGIIRDISIQKLAQEELNYQAAHDSLTGLINRREFENRVNVVLSDMKSGENQKSHAICCLDLDQFKVVNDTFGHVVGDQLLQKIGTLLQNTLRSSDTLARLGGDEFGILLKRCTLEEAQSIANDILNKVLNYQFHWKGKIFKIGVSIGLVVITKDSADFTDLFMQADAACYLAKERGRNRIHIYHPDDAELAKRQRDMSWVGMINEALDGNRFCLYAQEIFPLDESESKHFELLIRMLDETGKIVPPARFLPAAERYNLIEKLDAWVVLHACTFISRHTKALADVALFTINLSGPSLTNSAFLEHIIQVFKHSGVAPNKICFEVTETVAISNLDSAVTFIKTLKQLGFRFALDDFGSGISSFGYLKNLPVDYLKIDGMFVKGIAHDPIDYAMVKSINEIGQIMGMQTIAEFVENDEIKVKLQELGVNYGQGYGLGKPKPLEDLLK
jgi:diguanylate cyclase (GGDEF)-like protein/PAS domain S-box-containing protein